MADTTPQGDILNDDQATWDAYEAYLLDKIDDPDLVPPPVPADIRQRTTAKLGNSMAKVTRDVRDWIHGDAVGGLLDGAVRIRGGILLRDSTLMRAGAGNPEGNVVASVGSQYLRTDAPDASNLIYVKGSGVGNVGWTPIGSGGGSVTADPTSDAGQVKTNLSAISNQGILAPIGLWNLDQSLVDEVVGGAGNDLVAGFDGAIAWELLQGVPGVVGALYAAWFDGASALEADGGGNPGSKWNLQADLSVQCWAKMDDYQAEGGTNDPYRLVGFFNRSSTALGSTTAIPYVLGFLDKISGGRASNRVGHFETNGTSFAGPFWDIGGIRAKVPLGGWIHLAMTRTRIGLNNNTITMFVNGEQVGQILGQNDAGNPNSVNMRLQVGQGRGGTNGFPGSIRDVAIWDGVLPPADVRDMYRIGLGELV